MRAMVAVLRPGRLETDIAAWGAWVGRMLGSEADGVAVDNPFRTTEEQRFWMGLVEQDTKWAKRLIAK